MDASLQLLDRCESYKTFQQRLRTLKNSESVQQDDEPYPLLINYLREFSIWKIEIPNLIHESEEKIQEETEGWKDSATANQISLLWKDQQLRVNLEIQTKVQAIAQNVKLFFQTTPIAWDRFTEILGCPQLQLESIQESDPMAEKQALEQLLYRQQVLSGAKAYQQHCLTELSPLLQQAESAPSSQT